MAAGAASAGRSQAPKPLEVPAETRSVVAGYYSVSSTAVRLAELPESTRKRLPRYPLVPATVQGRLAVARMYRGRRLGERPLVDALRRSLNASRTVASVAVVVGATDDAGAAFYAR